jgi:uncharacterized protein YegP (UPF0339 family)
MRTSVRGLLVSLALTAVLAVAALPGAGQAQKDKDKDKDTKAVATFELYKDSANEFRFRFKDDDGELLATSGKGYKSKADCQKVIDAIKSSAAKAKVDDQTK